MICDHCGGEVRESATTHGALAHVNERDWKPSPHKVRINGMCGACSNGDHSRHQRELPAGANCIGCPCPEGTQ